jgi:hypothetical protein
MKLISVNQTQIRVPAAPGSQKKLRDEKQSGIFCIVARCR